MPNAFSLSPPRIKKTAQRSPGSTLQHIQAMTLFEIMISIGIFGVVAVSIIGVILQSRRIAEMNIYESTALTAAQGYLEQIKTMDYATLATTSLPTLPQAITPNQWNTPPAIDINLTTANTADDIPFRIKPTITNLFTDGTAPITGLKCYEIVIDYEFDARIYKTLKTYKGNVRLIRAAVPTY